MKKRRKIFFWLAGSSGIIILILLALNYLIPRLINSELLKGKIETIISQRIGGEAAFKEIDLTIFPLPHATFLQGNISTEVVSASIDSISIYPEILPLLRGRLQGGTVVVISPDISINLSGHKETEGQKPVTPELITNLLASIAPVYPGHVLILEDGSINLIKEDNSISQLEGLDLRIDLPSTGLKDIKADLESSSLKLSAWRDDKEIAVMASRLKGGLRYDKDKTSVYLSEIVFDFPDLKLSGELGIDNSSRLISLSVEAKELDVKSVREVALAIAGDTPEVQEIFQIIKGGNIPSITISSEASSFDDVFKTENIVINGSMNGGEIFIPDAGINLEGVNVSRFYYDKYKTSVFFSEMIFGSPDLRLSGELGIDNSSRLINLSVEGKGLDVKSVREAVLSIAGDTPEVQKIFQIIKGGNIPSITISSEASSFDDVVKAENMVINGSMSGGEIFIPDAGINLKGVNVSRFYYDKAGVRVVNLSGSAGKPSLIANPPHVSMDIFNDSDDLRITNLTVRDEATDAVLNLKIKKKVLEVSFAGQLNQTTLDKVFSKNISHGGSMKGDIRARIYLDRPLQSILEGTLDGEDILFHWRPWGPVKIKTISLDAKGRNLKINSARLEIIDKVFSLKGDVNASEEALFFDMDVSTDGIEWESISEAFEQERDDKGDGELWDVAYKGTIRFDSDYFTYDRFTLKPFRADVSLEPNKIYIVVKDAAICGISFPANLYVSSGDLSVNLQPWARDQELDSALDCFWGKSIHNTGTFDIKGEFNAKGRGESLSDSLRGNLELIAKDGMIHQNILLSRVFALLNPSVYFDGKLPDLAEEGFPYNTITAEADFRENNLLIEELIIDGLSMKIAGYGSINLEDNEMDMEILVSPWKTPGNIIEKLPIIKEIVPGSILSIPVKATGSYDDPQVIYFSPSMVGSRILEIMENTLMAPVNVIEPLLPGSNEQDIQ